MGERKSIVSCRWIALLSHFVGGTTLVLGLSALAYARQQVTRSYVVSGKISTSAKMIYEYLKEPDNWYKHTPT